MPQRMCIKKIKNRINVVEGFISYPITIGTNTITCPCDQKLCKHIVYFLESKGLDQNLLEHWNRIKDHLIKNISHDQIDNSELWEIANQEISEMHCGFCLNGIKANHEYHVCPDCQGIVHVSCFRKWDMTGNGCMLCRSKTA